jgi:hypothetical protein
MDNEEIVINNSNEFKKYIVNYLNKNPSEFEKLNSGNISLKFGSFTNYTNTILDSNKIIYWNDVLDIISRITKINFMILDVPYKMSESTKISDYENTRLICYPDIKINKSHPFVFLLKRQNTYELIMLLTKESDSDKNSSIQFEFNYSESSSNNDIVNFFINYYKDSCVKENVFPVNFAYDELYSLNELINELNNTPHKIDYQIVNNFSKVDMILTKSGVLLPVKESGILNDYRIMTFSEVISEKLSSYSHLIKLYDNINTTLKTSKKFNVTGISVDSDNFMNAVFTNFGVFIPIKKEQFKKIEGLNVLYFSYYPEVNEYLNRSDSEIYSNEEIKYNEKIKIQKQKIYSIKLKLANFFVNNPDIKEKIENIIYSTNTNRQTKIKQIVKIFNENLEDSTENLDFYFDHIANEMLNDNKENLLLNNLVISDIFNPNEITQRESESILLNINDIKKWIKKYNRIE